MRGIVVSRLAAADQALLMADTAAPLPGIMARVTLKGPMVVRLPGTMDLATLMELMAVRLHGVMALEMRLEHAAARLAGVTAQAPLLARVVVQHHGAGECLMVSAIMRQPEKH